MLPWLALAALAAGCSQAARPADVDELQARETLVDALEAWKSGESLESMSQRTPPVLVQDPDWLKGLKLGNYTLEDSKVADGNFVARVLLEFADAQGTLRFQKAIYQVTTEPSLTVFRDIMLP